MRRPGNFNSANVLIIGRQGTGCERDDKSFCSQACRPRAGFRQGARTALSACCFWLITDFWDHEVAPRPHRSPIPEIPRRTGTPGSPSPAFSARSSPGTERPRLISPMKYRWSIAPAQPALAEFLARELRISPLLAQCLLNRGLSEPEPIGRFLQPRLKDLADPFLLPNMRAA